MKKLLLFLACITLFSSCIYTRTDDDATLPQNYYNPVVVDRATFESSVEVLPTQNIVNSGKIYVIDNLLFINEFRKGFHVLNYSNPENPEPIAFIKIPGATDVAVRNSTLYINQATDLVTLNYNATANSLTIANRNRNVFPQMASPNGMFASVGENEIIIDWIEQY